MKIARYHCMLLATASCSFQLEGQPDPLCLLKGDCAVFSTDGDPDMVAAGAAEAMRQAGGNLRVESRGEYVGRMWGRLLGWRIRRAWRLARGRPW